MTRVDLSTALRKSLEKAVQQARNAAATGAADTIRRLGVAAASPPAHLNEAAKALRVRLRAHARSLGDSRRSDDSHEVKRLTEESAYAHWHRLLFARFLLERRLLREPQSGGEVTLDDCRELAGAQGLPDAWAAAERFASAMLPGVFRPDDPVLALDFAPEHTAALQRILQSLDPATFQADDSLGWTYQFWRAAEKDAVNRAGEKIGADSLPAVTQLFTEPYMVRFLLHNTLGAWWAGKVLAAEAKLAKDAPDEATLRMVCTLPGIDWEYLRFVKETGAWRPAAGTFPGWPHEAKAISMLDPCCGSGHFLVEAFAILAALRSKEEKLTPAAAAGVVLKDNLFGLELDGRCVQLASFAIALAAWQFGGRATVLPNPHIAWVGAPPPLPEGEFVALAGGNAELARALYALHELFTRAPLLGSLIEPTGGDLVDPVRIARIDELLEPLILKARAAELEQVEGTIAARGMADAVAILTRRFTLQATNLPFLGRADQEDQLADYIKARFPMSSSDLSTAMLERLFLLAERGGAVATVTKQEWCFLGSYSDLRKMLLSNEELNVFVTLGEEAWEAFGMRGPLATLSVWTAQKATPNSNHFCLDTTSIPQRLEKAKFLEVGPPILISQQDQKDNPDFRIATSISKRQNLLAKYAHSFQGTSTGDADRYRRFFWETNAKAQS